MGHILGWEYLCQKHPNIVPEKAINFEEDDFRNTNNMMGTDEVQSMSFSEAPRSAQFQFQLEESSKKKRKKCK